MLRRLHSSPTVRAYRCPALAAGATMHELSKLYASKLCLVARYYQVCSTRAHVRHLCTQGRGAAVGRAAGEHALHYQTFFVLRAAAAALDFAVTEM